MRTTTSGAATRALGGTPETVRARARWLAVACAVAVALLLVVLGCAGPPDQVGPQVGTATASASGTSSTGGTTGGTTTTRGGEPTQDPPDDVVVIVTAAPLVGQLDFDGEVSCGLLVWQAEPLAEGMEFVVDLTFDATWRESVRPCPGLDAPRCSAGPLAGGSPSCLVVLEPVDPAAVDVTAHLSASGALRCTPAVGEEACRSPAAAMAEAAPAGPVPVVPDDDRPVETPTSFAVDPPTGPTPTVEPEAVP